MTKRSEKKSRAKHKKRVSAQARRLADSQRATAGSESSLQEAGTSGDRASGNLSRAKTSWLLGEWNELAAVALDDISSDPSRAVMALLIGSAHQQLADHDAARRFVRQSLSWGCEREVVAQVLVAGVHNTLGRAAALLLDDKRAMEHFNSAVSVATHSRNQLGLSRLRGLKEMATAGLIPQATAMLGRELSEARKLGEQPVGMDARLGMLETELELLSHELSLAQQRGQVSPGAVKSGVPIAGKLNSVSQLGQDVWVLEKSGFKRSGYFVEFGATDGVLLSNTYLLETQFGWQGLCAEPNPKFFAQLAKNRRCAVSQACIGAETGAELSFVFADAYGGFEKHAGADEHAHKRAAYVAAGKTARLTTISLHDFLRENNAPRNIDYLSVDTEGSELEILSAFPFDQWNIHLITVEHNFGPQRLKIRELLERHGYECEENKWDDWYTKVNA